MHTLSNFNQLHEVSHQINAICEVSMTMIFNLFLILNFIKVLFHLSYKSDPLMVPRNLYVVVTIKKLLKVLYPSSNFLKYGDQSPNCTSNVISMNFSCFFMDKITR